MVTTHEIPFYDILFFSVLSLEYLFFTLFESYP